MKENMRNGLILVAVVGLMVILNISPFLIANGQTNPFQTNPPPPVIEGGVTRIVQLPVNEPSGYFGGPPLERIDIDIWNIINWNINARPLWVTRTETLPDGSISTSSSSFYFYPISDAMALETVLGQSILNSDGLPKIFWRYAVSPADDFFLIFEMGGSWYTSNLAVRESMTSPYVLEDFLKSCLEVNI